MNVIQYHIPTGTKRRRGFPMTPEYVTIHNTGNTSKGATAYAHAKMCSNTANEKATSYQYVVDDKDVYELMPPDEVAWHAGDGFNGKGNRTSIGIEICENPDGDLYKATDKAVMLTAHLCKQFNIQFENVVLHNLWCGKDCPQRLRRGQPYSWNTFIEKVEDAMNAEMTVAEAKAIVQEKAGLSDSTMLYLVEQYRWGNDLIVKLAKAMSR